MTDLTAAAAPGPARLLGFAGLIPFFGLAALAMSGVPGADAWLTGYGAIILSFMGGCRWGFAAAGLGEGASVVALSCAVAPALYAWAVAEALAPAVAGPLLALGFAALFVADIALTRADGAPPWWPDLRRPLSLGAVLCCGLLALG